MRYFIIIFFILFAKSGFCLSTETGGHIRLYGSSSFFGDDNIIKDSEIDNPYLDYSSNLRMKTDLLFSHRINLDIHYEAGGSGGDFRRAVSGTDSCRGLYPALKKSDKSKLFNLTSYTDSDDREYYHRIDRLQLKYSGDSFSFSMGRQAISTGNGLIFNPMDILNPFAPADVVKDYKTGTDMALFQFSGELISDGTIIFVPGRNEAGDLDSDESSCAFKLKSIFNETEAGIFYAKHYGDDVFGVSFSGFLKSAAWRSDILWTKTDSQTECGYFSSIVNIDYSWVIKNKNWYGLIEFYYSGIGEEDVKDSQFKEELLKRIERGELYNTAEKYLGLKIQNEIHPLVNLYLTWMINLDDYSSFIQPGVKWSALENFEILFGADLPCGGDNTEFMGVKDPLTDKSSGPGIKGYVQGTYYF